MKYFLTAYTIVCWTCIYSIWVNVSGGWLLGGLLIWPVWELTSRTLRTWGGGL